MLYMLYIISMYFGVDAMVSHWPHGHCALYNSYYIMYNKDIKRKGPTLVGLYLKSYGALSPSRDP